MKKSDFEPALDFWGGNGGVFILTFPRTPYAVLDTVPLLYDAKPVELVLADNASTVRSNDAYVFMGGAI